MPQAPQTCHYLQTVHKHVCFNRVSALFLNFGLFGVFEGHIWLKNGQKWTFFRKNISKSPKIVILSEKTINPDFFVVSNTIKYHDKHLYPPKIFIYTIFIF